MRRDLNFMVTKFCCNALVGASPLDVCQGAEFGLCQQGHCTLSVMAMATSLVREETIAYEIGACDKLDPDMRMSKFFWGGICIILHICGMSQLTH